MEDVQENAAIVNALQRHAAVVVQKSLLEGFGLTVTEAMWKGRPVVASAVGGIQDQIVDAEHGLLLRDPRDLESFSQALGRVLSDPGEARRLGENAKRRVAREFLGFSAPGEVRRPHRAPRQRLRRRGAARALRRRCLRRTGFRGRSRRRAAGDVVQIFGFASWCDASSIVLQSLSRSARVRPRRARTRSAIEHPYSTLWGEMRRCLAMAPRGIR